MNRMVVGKNSLHDADDALCIGLTVAERLDVLAELNRTGLAAVGVADAPLERAAIRKYPFAEYREFLERPLCRVPGPFPTVVH